jgi:hypothetical protein
VIDVNAGCAGPGGARVSEIDRRAAKWPVPSVSVIRNTSLMEIDGLNPNPIFGRWSESVDAILYLGPSDLGLTQPMPAHIWLDSAYLAELGRRYAIPGAASARAKTLIDPASIRESEVNPFVCNR